MLPLLITTGVSDPAISDSAARPCSISPVPHNRAGHGASRQAQEVVIDIVLGDTRRAISPTPDDPAITCPGVDDVVFFVQLPDIGRVEGLTPGGLRSFPIT